MFIFLKRPAIVVDEPTATEPTVTGGGDQPSISLGGGRVSSHKRLLLLGPRWKGGRGIVGRVVGDDEETDVDSETPSISTGGQTTYRYF
jgi:hypothetical protein